MQKAWAPSLVVLACMALFLTQVGQNEEVYVLALDDEYYEDTEFLGDFPISFPTPKILQFSCAVMISPRAQKLAWQLENAKGPSQLGAAKELWRGHCRPHAEAVLKFLEDSKSQSPDFRDFRREVEISLQPESILNELKEGDFKWGAWLAYLRPHKSLVPVLLEALKNDPKKVKLAETLVALGKSNDKRAIEPLIQFLMSDGYYDSWAAATAIGLVEIEVPGLEDQLLACLPKKRGLAAAEVCDVLGKIGTKKSLPKLQEIAAIKYEGVIDVAGAAKRAIEKINQRTMSMPDPIP